MASLRGGGDLWTATSGTGITQNAVSAPVFVGSAPYVSLFIKGGATASVFKVQVTGIAADRPGINELDQTVGGGATWYDYDGALTLTVGISTNVAFDLSPFAPSIIRLVRTDAAAATDISALVVTNGPN